MGKNLYQKAGAFILGLINILFGSYLLMNFLSLISELLLRSGYNEGMGAYQFLKVVAGIILLLLIAFLWLSLIVFCIQYYLKHADSRMFLLKYFSLITSLEFYLLSLLVIIIMIITPQPILIYDWILFLFGVTGGSLFIYLYSRYKLN